jgi:hypothetical protein
MIEATDEHMAELGPLAVLPVQMTANRAEVGEKRLQLALIEDALSRVAHSGDCEDERRWIEADENGFGRFLFACEVTGLEPGPIRRFARLLFQKHTRFRLHRVTGHRPRNRRE